MPYRIVNCTPHDIRLLRPDTPDQIDETDLDKWTALVIPAPEGRPARIGEIDLGTQSWPTNLGEIPVEYVEYRHVNDLPPPVEGTFYVVSHVLALTLAYVAEGGRGDLLVTYSAVRNRNNTTVGSRLLARPV